MSIDNQLQKVKELYSANLLELGATSKSVGWNTEDCQNLRFTKLAEVIEDRSQPFSVNDYGCGYGAMAQFFRDDLKLSVDAYNGYDISSEMLQSAEKLLAPAQANLNLLESKVISTEADYSFVSGTFNVRFDATRQEWEQFMTEKLHEMNRFSRKGFAFNVLTSYVDWEEPHLYYGNPNFWFDFCKKNFSRYVSLFHDYRLWEWTLIVKK